MIEFSANPAACLANKVELSAALRLSRFLPRYMARQLMGRQHIARRLHRDTAGYAVTGTPEHWLDQFVYQRATKAYWPVDRSSKVVNWRNVRIGIDVAPGFMPNCYIQGIGLIDIGDYVWIAPGVHIISANHDIHDHRLHHPDRVTIGRHSWLGGGAKIMPGVELGPFSIVAAGAVVTRSFPQGYQVLAGIPAKPVRQIDPASCVDYARDHRYHGYIPEADFPAFAKQALNPALQGD